MKNNKQILKNMKNQKKQTAVDYLFLRMEVLRGLFLFEEIDYKEYVDEKKDAFEKAKEMEKQQKIQFGYRCIGEVGVELGDLIYKKLPEEIYNKEYGK